MLRELVKRRKRRRGIIS